MNHLVLNQINSSLICGQDCKYDDSFLLIEQEIDKTYSVNQEEETNWEYVVENCEKILLEKSKDIKVSSWYLYGLIKQNSFNNFENSLRIYIKLLETFSTQMHPKSLKAKRNIFLWLEELLTNDLLNNIAKINKEDFLQYYTYFIRLDTVIKMILENDSESFFKKIIKYFEENKIKKLTQTTSNNKISSTNEQEIKEITNKDEALKVMRNFKKYALMLTKYYRSNNISDLKALRITRLLSFLEIEGLPPSENNITHLNPPSILEINEIEDNYKNKNYEEAFLLVEEILEVCPFWLDGHYYAFNILEKTNNNIESFEAKKTFLNFIEINENIEKLYFNDETPFASNKVKNWLKENLINKLEEPKNLLVQSTKDKDDLDKAYKLAEENKIKDAMKLLEGNYNYASSFEDKFNWRLNHAKLSLQYNKNDIALVLLEDLEKEIDRFYLYEWNPKLAANVYTLILSSFNNTDIDTEKINTIYNKLCKIDINSAYELKI
ncbi:ImpA domain protein [Arcobacter nitrofigilis DSM 7299]|uniref:ImpA domain protein n=1 Tax=Arcobacter nitrofigilis (strain ATCC 33309 / DSM 7299 / CCUG 15893 / LMG 7604 / NCTC 12251 / CI) TaxID=572480 RepID=D5V1G1_ARCNC|nr:type VI secretion system protein TssA [Arcobacter nitrofigilis]ADG93395.1 ImpA domain protein [Arcobacter nitrofigilis DSM 7299]